MRNRLARITERFFSELDAEKISPFQLWIYYPTIMCGGLYLLFVANGATDPAENTLGHPYYEVWCALNVICPTLTYVGRRAYNRAALAGVGEPHGGAGGAWMQLAGDGGVWGVILIYLGCILNTTEWGKPLYTTFYFLMGIPGGFFFTLRSARRLMQIRRIRQQLS